jgi:hypothetical protein
MNGNLTSRISQAALTAPITAALGLLPGCGQLLGNSFDVTLVADAATDADSPRLPDAGSGSDGTGSNAAGVDGRAEAGGAVCTDACSLHATRCSGGNVQTCGAQADGCARWVTTSVCGSHETCVATGAAASCACLSTLCSQPGDVCQDTQTLVACMMDSDGCLYVASTSLCTSPDSCSGRPPSAACAQKCTDSCSDGKTSCVSGQLATCSRQTNGCLAYGVPTACGPQQTCSGTAGSAACACANACTAGVSQCGGGGIQTCQAQANGCPALTTTSTCSPGLACERYAGPACLDPSWAEWPISPAPTYTDHGDGTVSDNLTLLMWQKATSTSMYTWGSTTTAGTAQNYCATLALAGYSDWRLPTYIELLSLVDYAVVTPSIDPVFTNTPPTLFWTSTPYAGAAGGAWVVRFDVGISSSGATTAPNYVRCVR